MRPDNTLHVEIVNGRPQLWIDGHMVRQIRPSAGRSLHQTQIGIVAMSLFGELLLDKEATAQRLHVVSGSKMQSRCMKIQFCYVRRALEAHGLSISKGPTGSGIKKRYPGFRYQLLNLNA